MADVRKLVIQVVGDTASLKKGSGDADTFGEKFAGAAKKVGIALGAAGVAVTAFSKKATDTTAAFTMSAIKLSRETGVTVTEASRLNFVAQRMGMSADSASTSFGIFSKQITIASDNTSVTAAKQQQLATKIDQTKQKIQALTLEKQKYGDASGDITRKIEKLSADLASLTAQSSKAASPFQKLGVNVKDANGKLRPFNELLLEVADKFKVLPDGAEKTALAMQLFGRSGKDMIPLLNLGSQGIEKLSKKADELGITLTKGNVKAFQEYIKASGDLNSANLALQMSVGQKTIPVVTKFKTELTKVVENLVKADGATGDAAAAFLAFGGPVMSGAGAVLTLTANLATSIPMIANATKGIRAMIAAQLMNIRVGLMMAASSAASAARTAASWVAAAARSTASFAVMAARAVASFAVMAAAATASAVRIAVALTVTAVAGMAGFIARMAVTAALFVAQWVFMGAQAMANAIRIAAAWIIALGPIAWIVAAIVAVAAIIILNWQKIWNFIKPVVTAIGNTIKSVFQGIWNWIKNTLSGVASFWSNAWNKVKSVATAVWNGIKAVVNAGINFVKNYIRNAVSNILAIWNGIKRIASVIANVFSNVVSAVRNGISRAVGAVKGFIGKFVSVGADIINGIVRGIKSVGGAIFNAIKGAAGKAWNLIKKFLGIGSPSKEYEKLGKWMMAGMANGIVAGQSDVIKAMDKTAAMVDGSTLNTPTASVAAGQVAAQAAVSQATVQAQPQQGKAPVHIEFTVHIGMYAGTAPEKRKIAMELWREVVRQGKSEGLPVDPILGGLVK